MIALGLILIVLAVGAGVLLFLETQSLTTPVELDAAGYQWSMTPLALLITGAVVMLAFLLGLAMIRGSLKRKRRPAREAKEADRQAKFEERIRADERSRAEETHQSALAERDRVRDEELQSKLSERERERDDQFASRQDEAERRIRADERAKVEQELSSRQAATAAGAGGGAVAGGGVHGAASSDQPGSYGDRHRDQSDDRVRDDRTQTLGADSDRSSDVGDGGAHRSDDERVATASDYGNNPERRTHEDSSHTSGRDSESGTDREGRTDEVAGDRDSGGTDSRTDADRDRADGTQREDAADEGADASSHSAFRTVADKIMGREPHDRS